MKIHQILSEFFNKKYIKINQNLNFLKFRQENRNENEPNHKEKKNI